jgi:hypothetical protein
MVTKCVLNELFKSYILDSWIYLPTEIAAESFNNFNRV